MRIALAQINPTIGDIAGNAALIRRDIHRAAAAGADLVVFPELSIIGYPPRDLLLKQAVIADCEAAMQQLAGECTAIAAIIGYPRPAATPRGRALHNAAAFCADGRIVQHHIKSLLPTYDVFDESRYFEPGPRVDLSEYRGLRFGISICEDLWNDERMFSHQLYHDNPMDELARMGANLFINCSASPFVMEKHAFRLELMANAARKYKLPLVYCNQVGGNDELVFDGNSCAFDKEGNLITHAGDFEEDLLLVDVSVPVNPFADADASAGADPAPDVQVNRIRTSKTGMAAAYHALVLGLRDYCRKCGFQSIVVGLSGGIDSAVTAALAAAALGPEQVRGIAMPSRYSSQGSVDDAAALAQQLGIAYHVVPIDQPHTAFEKLLLPMFEDRQADATEENVQARIRGIILMAMSNKFGSLLVTTGNKSELAVGYCTLYGDMAGGMAVISDVPKMMVYELARWINDDPQSPLRQQCGGPVIPETSITKPPSAELRPNQTDQDSLPPYEELDEIVERYVEHEQAARTIIAETGYDPQTVLRVVNLIDRNEYKRKQAAPGLKITGRAFGIGRRMPIAQRYRGEVPKNEE